MRGSRRDMLQSVFQASSMMTSLNYVEPPNSNLICCICHVPFTNPTTTRSCMHTFCHDCVVEAVRHSPHCPIDRSPISLEDLVPANPIVKHLVDELVVECPLRTAGCLHTCQRQLLESHMKDTCQYVTVPCSEDGCDQIILRKDRGKHADVCVHRSTECDGCGASIKYSDLTAHYSECSSKNATCSFCASEFLRSSLHDHIAACPQVIVPCPHADNGCPWTGKRQELSALHISSCAYESIKGFFAIHGARVSTLSAENIVLRQRVEALEGMVHLMQHDMQSFKTILGPWYRSEMHRTNSRDFRPVRVPENNHLQGFVGPSHYRTVAQHTQVSAAPESFESIDAEPDAVASFFPSSDVLYDNHGHMHARTPSGLLDIQSHAGQRSLPLSLVAPLNLSTSLEGSLVGLRDSVTAVAASVDSLARRHDIALTNESMRINEELGSLKYAVHGIRLQLHRLMMDRNAQVTGRMGEQGPVAPVPIPAPTAQPIFHPLIMTPPFPPPPGTKL